MRMLINVMLLVALVLASGARANAQNSTALSVRQAQSSVETLVEAGTQAFEKGNFKQALSDYRQALTSAETAGDVEHQYFCLFLMAVAYRNLDQNDTALEYLQKAVDIKPIDAQPADTDGEFGLIYRLEQNYQKALEYDMKAFVNAQDKGDKEEQEAVSTYIRLDCFHLNRYDKAIDFGKKLSAIAVARGDHKREAAELIFIGDMYDDLAEYYQALDCDLKALAITKAMKDEGAEEDDLGKLGRVYYDLGQYEKSLHSFQTMLEIANRKNDLPAKAHALSGLGIDYEALGQNSKALDNLTYAISVAADSNNSIGMVNVFDNLAEASMLMSDPDLALSFEKYALDKARDNHSDEGEISALINYGAIYEHQLKYDDALSYFQRALMKAHAIGATSQYAQGLSKMAVLYRDGFHNPLLAIFYGKQAVNAYQAIRGNISNMDPETREKYLKSHETTYRDLADLLIAQHRVSEAEHVLHMLKEKEYYDYIHKAPESVGVTVNIETLPPTTAQEKAWDTSYKASLLSAVADFNLASTPVIPHGSMTVAETPPSYAAPILATSDPHTVLVTTIVSSDELVEIVETVNDQWVHTTPIKSTDLYNQVSALRSALMDRTHDPTKASEDIYDVLVKPIEGDLAKVQADTVVWSLDDALRYVPIPALYDGKHYLVERPCRNVVINLAASGTTGQNGNARQKGASETALGAGVSVQHWMTLPGDNHQTLFPKLPGVRIELQGIIHTTQDAVGSGIMPGQRLINSDFTRDALIKDLHKGYRVVHFASHFSLGAMAPQSYLVLGDGTVWPVSDILKSPDLFKGVDLLTLSACQTNVDMKSGHGNEIEGFGALMQHLGAHSVIATLWPVDDIATSRLMPTFYKLRETGLSKAEAIRQAQLALLGAPVIPTSDVTTKQQRGVEMEESVADANTSPFKVAPAHPYSHPYYWAPFILIGDWR